MTKVPQRDEIWRDKYDGKLVRIRNFSGDYVFFFENKDNKIWADALNLELFYKLFEFVGDGKPIDVLFEVVD